MRITKTFVDKLDPPAAKNNKATQAFYRDSSMPGFGLRATSGGSKAFIIETRINGKVKRITLGKYGKLTVEQARKEAAKYLGAVASGRDPANEKKSKQLKQITLNQAFEDYLTTRKNLAPGTIHDYNRVMRETFEDWKTKPITAITKDMVETRHAKRGKRSPARANNAMRVLRAVFNHARLKYEDNNGLAIVQINPVDRISQNRAWFSIERRQTLIKPHELRKWYEGTRCLNNLVTRDYLYFVLLTGLRRTEAASLRWDAVDFNDSTFTLLETKNGRTHTLPFSSAIQDILARRKEETDSEFVFPGKAPNTHLVEPRTAVKRVATLSGVPFTVHDLRRTFITIAESLDVPAYSLKRLLNHKDPNDVTEGYIIFDVNRLREPMQKITDFMLKSMGSNDLAIEENEAKC